MKNLFIAVTTICLAGILAAPAPAQDLQNQLNRYVTSQLSDDEKASFAQSSEEKMPEDAIYREIESMLRSLLETNTCPLPEVAQDLTQYIKEEAFFSATGQLNGWEQKRSELYRYIQNSNWRTGKNISNADRAFRETLQTIFFGLFKQLAQLCGWDRLLDRLEQEAINRYENNEEIQIAIATVAANISDATHEENHTVNDLYNDIQHNAFTLLTINSVDFNKLTAAYPEVKFLFDDMYTFFKWRYDLRNTDESYKLNENNIHVEFRLAASTNSFFAFWELANIAKAEMRNAAENSENRGNNLITLTVSDERDNMRLFETYANEALYFGRVWNGMQEYAVKRGILPENLDPKRGARKNSIKKSIENSFNGLSNEQILSILDNVRNYYASAREISENYWNEWATRQNEQQIQEYLQGLLQKIEQAADSLSTQQNIDSLQVQPE